MKAGEGMRSGILAATSLWWSVKVWGGRAGKLMTAC